MSSGGLLIRQIRQLAHLKTETESSLRKVEFLIRERMVDNVQNCDSYINIPLSQTFR
jgi:hypothetical protein